MSFDSRPTGSRMVTRLFAPAIATGTFTGGAALSPSYAAHRRVKVALPYFKHSGRSLPYGGRLKLTLAVSWLEGHSARRELGAATVE